jgi:hypothetical protein
MPIPEETPDRDLAGELIASLAAEEKFIVRLTRLQLGALADAAIAVEIEADEGETGESLSWTRERLNALTDGRRALMNMLRRVR